MKLFNTMTRKKEKFVSLEPNAVKMYVCGPTVYNYFHIGNARPFVLFDVLRRYFEYKEYAVTYVQNFTDIDDKMIKRANEEGITIEALADRFIQAYYEDAGALGIRPADYHPKATEHMPEIIALIEKLQAKGLAYAARGDVYFDTQAYKQHYGRLLGQNLDDLESGARVDVDENKKHPMDFALWKARKPGEPAWESPWGTGRPGWHIECSAMSMKYLGETIDIHGGGQDLVFPHHENEIAQSEGATGKQFVRYWMHNGFLNIDNEKMSKSLGNFLTVHDILKVYNPEAVRFFLLSAHYRSPMNFSEEQIAQAKAALERLYTARDAYRFMLEKAADQAAPTEESLELGQAAQAMLRKFEEAMEDDLNTADALGVLFELVKQANTRMGINTPKQAIEAVLDVFGKICGVLGIVSQKGENLEEKLEPYLAARAQAREGKNWKESDRIRDELKAMGYIVEDTAQGQKVRKA